MRDKSVIFEISCKYWLILVLYIMYVVSWWLHNCKSFLLYREIVSNNWAETINNTTHVNTKSDSVYLMVYNSYVCEVTPMPSSFNIHSTGDYQDFWVIQSGAMILGIFMSTYVVSNMSTVPTAGVLDNLKWDDE